MKKRIAWSFAFLIVVCLMGCGTKPKEQEVFPPEEHLQDERNTETVSAPKSDIEWIGDAILLRAAYGDEGNKNIEKIYEKVCSNDPEQGKLWSDIDAYWKTELNSLEIHYQELPYDLSDGSDLAIVILGYGLQSDGTMKEELIDRLQVGLNCAWQYPNAYVVCTGGGSVPNAKEADVMGQWLLEEGLEEERLILENESMTTGQNARNTGKLLQEFYPEIHQIALVTSDYHIPWALLLFKAETMILNQTESCEINVVSNAANETGKKVNTEMSKAAGLLEILGDSSRAAEIYHKDYSSVPALD